MIRDASDLTVDEAVTFFRAVSPIYDACLTLAEVVPPEQRLLTWGGLFLVRPSRQSWVGFVVALAICMADEEVWYQTGIVLNNLGRYAEAVKCFDRALLLNPAFTEAYEARRIARGNVGG